jgi:hypothetical protein
VSEGRFGIRYRINGARFRRAFPTMLERDRYAAILIANGIAVVLTGTLAQ